MIRKISWSIVLVLCLTVVIFITSSSTGKANSSKELGKINTVIGKVEVKEKGKNAVNAFVGMNLKADQVVNTDGKSKCVITMANGSKISMGPKAKVVLNEALASKVNKQSSAGVLDGTVHVLVSKSGSKAGTIVNTPSTVAGARGTEFLIGVAETGATNVMVLEGIVEVMGSGPSSQNQQKSGLMLVKVNEQATNDVVSDPKKNIIVENSNKKELSIADCKDGLGDFKSTEEKKVKENPVAVLELMTKKIDKVDEGTDKSINKVKNATNEIKSSNSKGDKPNSAQIVKIKEIDAQISTNKNQNDAIAQLAELVAEENPNNQTKKQADKINEKHKKVVEKQSELSKFINQMEKEMDAFIMKHAADIEKMAGFDDDDDFDINQGFEDFDMND